MNRYEKLILKARNGKIILLDGATGTEAERRGVPQLKHAWNGGAAITHPEILMEIHEEYINLGSEIIISNTFANSMHALEDANESENFYCLNEQGIKLAIKARKNLSKKDVLVAGGISYWTWTGRYPSLKQLSDSVFQQTKIFSDAGADLIVLEMMIDIERMLKTLNTVKKFDLPVWVGLSCKLNDEGKSCLLDGDNLKDAIEALKDKEIDVINIMHTDIEYVLPVLKELRNLWDGLIGVYPHSGSYAEFGYRLDTNWRFDDVISPEDFIVYAKKWKDLNINFLGGCCGINSNHLLEVSKILK